VEMILHPFLKVLTYLHQNCVVHRDIKPENVLFTRSMQLKICDFGLAIDLREERAVTRAGENCLWIDLYLHTDLGLFWVLGEQIMSVLEQRKMLSCVHYTNAINLLKFTDQIFSNHLHGHSSHLRDSRVHGSRGSGLPLQKQTRGKQGA
jgi:serine/threonine protein kinase